MGTASTRSRAGKGKRARKDAPSTQSEQAEGVLLKRQQKRKEAQELLPEPARTEDFPRWFWLAASALILVTSAFLRIYQYGLKPFHHDEGVNGFFLINLFRNHIYNYDPSNYHGPTLYYFSLLSTLLFGLNDFAVRLVPAVFGVATVWLMLALRRYIGTVGALTAAALMAVSPAAVFYSRYFIHESLFVFFSVALVVSVLSFDEQERPVDWNLSDGWTGLIAAASVALLAYVGARSPELMARNLPGVSVTYKTVLLIVVLLVLCVALTFLWRFGGTKLLYLAAAFASASLLFATKETALITVGVFLIALVSTEIYMRMRHGKPTRGKSRKAKRGREESPARREGLTESLRRFGSARDWVILIGASLAIFTVIHILFYTSFFTNPKGLDDSIVTFKIWMRTGTSEFHAKTWETYLYWLWQEEALLLLIGAAGVILAAWRAATRFTVFTALWAIGIISAYSLVPYKTPWLVLSFIPPLAIMAGYVVNELYRQGTMAARAAALAVVLMAVTFATYQTVVLNFYKYDDESYPYVYAHTQRQYLDLIREIKRAAQQAGTGGQTTISIASVDYWPMPWYLRDFKSVAYPARASASQTEQIVVCNGSQKAECQALLGGRYREIGSYHLRSGIMLVLFVRNDIAGKG